MQPNQQQPYQPGQVFQPQQPPQQPNSLDFTQNNQPNPPQPTSQQPQQPAFDPVAFKQEVIDGVKSALQPQQPTQQPQNPQTPEQTQPKKQYDEWGSVFEDVDKLVEQKLEQREQQNQTIAQQAEQQEQQNQQIIDSTLDQLRGAGYLPQVQNKFDSNDPGKQAENELIGYAVKLGTTDLASAADELKKHHERGEYYNYQTKQWVQTNVPQDTGQSIFGNLPVSPDQPIPNQQPTAPVVPPQQPYPPQYPQQQMYGPQNPYMPRPQYPAGFNVPVSNGGSYTGVGMQGQTPTVSTLRHNDYDSLVDMFNRTN